MCVKIRSLSIMVQFYGIWNFQVGPKCTVVEVTNANEEDNFWCTFISHCHRKYSPLQKITYNIKCKSSCFCLIEEAQILILNSEPPYYDVHPWFMANSLAKWHLRSHVWRPWLTTRDTCDTRRDTTWHPLTHMIAILLPYEYIMMHSTQVPTSWCMHYTNMTWCYWLFH